MPVRKSVGSNPTGVIAFASLLAGFSSNAQSTSQISSIFTKLNYSIGTTYIL